MGERDRNMRLRIEFVSKSNIILPVGYTKYVQALIYNIFSQKVRNFVHEEGYRSDRKFSLFCFSWILEEAKYFEKMKIFDFGQKISFYISSPVDDLIEDLINGLVKNDKFRIGENEIYLSVVTAIQKIFETPESIDIVALTPIEVHRTFMENGRNKTQYYSPFDKEFKELININIRDKWQAFYNEPLSEEIEITPLFGGEKAEKKYKRVVYYGFGDKKYIVEGWKGKYNLKGNPKVLSFVYDAGLGSKNSQGFGFIE